MLRKNEHELELRFGLLLRNEAAKQFDHSTGSWKQWWARWRNLLTVRYWLCEERGCVNPGKLWRYYVESGSARVRFVRILPLVVCYFAAGYLLLYLLGWPQVLARGAYARRWDWILARASALAVVLLTFYVADATLLNRRLIQYLTKGTTQWSQTAFDNLRALWCLQKRPRWLRRKDKHVPPNELLIDYLDIDLIAQRTEVVGGLIYYPFVITSLLILSRASIFDYWTWPLALILLIGFNVAYATFSAVYLRRTAELARTQALKRLNDRLMAYVAAGEGQCSDAEIIRETIKLIRAENRGAFAAVSQRPLLRALLLPSGSAGIWALLQYFPRLLGN